MGLFSRLKDRVIGVKNRNEPDFETVRSAVLGERYPPVNPAPGQKTGLEVDQPGWRTKYQDVGKYGEEASPREVALPSLETSTSGIDQPYSQALGMRRDEQQHKWDRRDFYDVMDRLGVIEAQLAAVRSQTETINERLKMMEIRMTRKY